MAIDRFFLVKKSTEIVLRIVMMLGRKKKELAMMFALIRNRHSLFEHVEGQLESSENDCFLRTKVGNDRTKAKWKQVDWLWISGESFKRRRSNRHRPGKMSGSRPNWIPWTEGRRAECWWTKSKWRARAIGRRLFDSLRNHTLRLPNKDRHHTMTESRAFWSLAINGDFWSFGQCQQHDFTCWLITHDMAFKTKKACITKPCQVEDQAPAKFLGNIQNSFHLPKKIFLKFFILVDKLKIKKNYQLEQKKG